MRNGEKVLVEVFCSRFVKANMFEPKKSGILDALSALAGKRNDIRLLQELVPRLQILAIAFIFKILLPVAVLGKYSIMLNNPNYRKTNPDNITIHGDLDSESVPGWY